MRARQSVEDNVAAAKLELISERQMMGEEHSAAVQQVERICQGRLNGLRTHLEAVVANSLQVNALYMRLAVTNLFNSAQQTSKHLQSGLCMLPGCSSYNRLEGRSHEAWQLMQVTEDRLNGVATHAAQAEQELQETKDSLSRLLWYASITPLLDPREFALTMNETFVPNHGRLRC